MIHLINMPFGSIHHPALGLCLIKEQLHQAGIKARVFDFNIMFARMIGFAGYEAIAMFKGVDIQVSEWLFAKYAWDKDPGPTENEFLNLCEKELPDIPKVPNTREWLKKIRHEVIPVFLSEAVKQLQYAGPLHAAGFSCLFFQTISSIALGKTLKQQHPDIRLAYGGPCFHDEMGDELIRKILWIDAVSTGEADNVVVPLFKALEQKNLPSDLQGILYRDESGTVRSDKPAEPMPKEFLEALPDPDFDDYFETARNFRIVPPPGHGSGLAYLLLEGSRGCWWGQNHHCTFCGLNGHGMGYRPKTGARIFQTISEYARRYPACRYHFTDNNLSMAYFKTLYPKLENSRFREQLSMFGEVRVTLNRAQLQDMSAAGIRYLQPGIESLSAHLLTLLRKGITVVQNLHFLKMCREYNIVPIWNNLIRIPGEHQADYTYMEKLIPKIMHLPPPHSTRGTCYIECHRFSPYFCEKNRWLENCRPQSWYKALFPGDLIDLSRVAYYFEAEWKDTLEPEAYAPVTELCKKWSKTWGREEVLPGLHMYARDDQGLDIRDTRNGQKTEISLSPDMAMIYQAISDPCETDKIKVNIEEKHGKKLSVNRIETCLDQFMEDQTAIEENGIYLGLALPGNTREPSLQERIQLYAREL
ncbi:MAG: RiPP maturation radical SAM protein 1 [Desulfobacterales bacterium]|nr:RiPP maturation radical SAM protein 1 [Desulfobacterales bacterium]